MIKSLMRGFSDEPANNAANVLQDIAFRTIIDLCRERASAGEFSVKIPYTNSPWLIARLKLNGLEMVHDEPYSVINWG